MKKINKYQTTELFNNDSARLNGFDNFLVLTEDNSLVHTKKRPIPGVIYINQLESDTAKMITGDVNGEIIQWIRNNSHRVLAKKTSDGTVTYCELDDTNSNKYFDGSEAKTDGTEGDVFVKLPTFYYRGNDTNEDGSSGDNVEIKFSKTPFEDSIEWNTNTLIGAYEAYYNRDTGKLLSCSGVASTTSGIKRDIIKTYANNRGTGYQIVDWQMHCVIGCLFFAIYGNTNTYSFCGEGTNEQKVCGETNILGMIDTDGSNGNEGSINFLGLENWWGNNREFIDNVDVNNHLWTITENGNTRQLQACSNNGFISKMRFGKYLDLLPIESKGSATTYFCGFYEQNSEELITVLRSGAYKERSVCDLKANINPSTSGATYSSRLAFRGICIKANSIEEFKSLSLS